MWEGREICIKLLWPSSSFSFFGEVEWKGRLATLATF